MDNRYYYPYYYQQNQDLNNNNNNNNNVNNDLENHYQQYQDFNNNNINNGVENNYQQYQGMNDSNVNINNGLENHYYQQYQGLNNNGGAAEVEYLDSFPAGYRFVPTDNELVSYYLMKKVNDEELPPNRIHEVKLYEFSPEYLSDKYRPNDRRVWFFFTHRDRKYKNGNRPSRGAGEGFWKPTGKDRPIKNLRGVEVGFKKALVYYDGKPPNGVKTNWIMHEYTVSNPPEVVRGPNNYMQLDKWVLCRIYHKDGKKNGKKKDTDDQSSSVTAPIPSPLSVIPSTSSFQSQDNVQIVSSATQIQSHAQDDRQIVVANVEDNNVHLNGLHDTDTGHQAHQINSNADDFSPSNLVSASLKPNSWQHKAMYPISNTNVQVSSSTTEFNPANVNVKPLIQDFNHSGYFSNSHSDNESVFIDADDIELQNLLNALAPLNGVITQQSVPIEVTAQQSASFNEVIAQQSVCACAESFTLGVIAQQSVCACAESFTLGGVIDQQSASADKQSSPVAGVAAQQSPPGTNVVSEQSALKNEVDPFADAENIATMLYFSDDCDFLYTP